MLTRPTKKQPEPGWRESLVDTEVKRQAIASRTPVGRHGPPDEIVGAAVFLASKAARK